MKVVFAIATLFLCIIQCNAILVQTNRTIFPSEYYLPSGYYYYYFFAGSYLTSSEILVAGSLCGSGKFGQFTLTSTNPYDDFYLASINRSTNVVSWAIRLGGYGRDELAAFGVDSKGDYLFIGHYYAGTNYGGSDFSSFYYDMVIVKYSGSTRTHVWSRNYGVTTGNDWAVTGCVDKNDNVIVGGNTNENVNWGGGALSVLGLDWVVAKFTGLNGDHIWSYRFGGNGNDILKHVSTDSKSDVVAVGSFQGNMTINGTVITSQGSPAGNDIFILKLANSTGSVLWYKTVGSPNAELATNAAFDSLNNVYVTGYFSGSINFGGGQMTTSNSTITNAFLVKYSSNGTFLWQKQFGSADTNSTGHSVSILANDMVLLSGSYSGSPTVNGVPITPTATYGCFIAKFDSDGTAVWGTGYANGVDPIINNVGAPYSSLIVFPFSCQARGFPGSSTEYVITVNYGSYGVGVTDLNSQVCPVTVPASETALVAVLAEVSPSPSVTPTTSPTPSMTPSSTPSTSPTTTPSPTSSTTPSTTPSSTPSSSITPSISRSPSVTPTTPAQESSKDDVPIVIIIPAVVGGCLLLIGAGFIAGLLIKKRKEQKDTTEIQMNDNM